MLSLSRPHAALLTNIYDAVGFMLGAIFSFFAVKSVELGEWKYPLCALACASAVTAVSMNLAMKLKPTRISNLNTGKVN